MSVQPSTDPDFVAVASAPARNEPGSVSLHRWDGRSGLGELVDELALDAPTWLEWSPDGTRLIVACEHDDGRIVTLGVSRGVEQGRARLQVVHEVSTGGAGPCHFAFTADRLHVVVANYRDGVVAAIAAEDGIPARLVDAVRLDGCGPNSERQSSSHPHQVVPSGGSLVSVVDLGADEIRSFDLRAGRLELHAVSMLPPGTGPRHFVRSSGSAVFLAAELSGQVLRLEERQLGHFDVVESCPASTSAVANMVAHILLDEAGHRLWVSNRGPDTLSTFDVSGTGLRHVSEAAVPAHPRHFVRVERRMLVAGLEGDAVSLCDLSPDGELGAGVTREVPAPACVAVVPARRQSVRQAGPQHP